MLQQTLYSPCSGPSLWYEIQILKYTDPNSTRYFPLLIYFHPVSNFLHIPRLSQLHHCAKLNLHSVQVHQHKSTSFDQEGFLKTWPSIVFVFYIFAGTDWLSPFYRKIDGMYPIILCCISTKVRHVFLPLLIIISIV